MHSKQFSGENDQADMKGTSMDDLPGTNNVNEDGNSEPEQQDADELENAERKAAEKREQEGGLR